MKTKQAFIYVSKDVVLFTTNQLFLKSWLIYITLWEFQHAALVYTFKMSSCQLIWPNYFNWGHETRDQNNIDILSMNLVITKLEIKCLIYIYQPSDLV